jgi:hypothetical protein
MVQVWLTKGKRRMDERDTQKGKYVTFKSGNEYFGLKIQYVNEIIVFQEIMEPDQLFFSCHCNLYVMSGLIFNENDFI